MNGLVQKLTTGDHPIAVPKYRTSADLKAAIDRGQVLVKFTDTCGGTELGVKLDPNLSDWANADFVGATGTIRLVGDLTLNYVRVKCMTTLDLSRLNGQGHLEIRE